jgi:hypothetical protein
MRRLWNWLWFGRLEPGEWRAKGWGEFLVRWSGNEDAIFQAAKYRCPGWTGIRVEPLAPEIWKVQITQRIEHSEAPKPQD